MKFCLLFATAFAVSVQAHTRVWSVYVNGVDQGDGRDQYIRSPPTNNPVKNVQSMDIRCNTNNRQVSRWINAKAGDTLTFEWYHNYRNDMIIDASHKGPTLTYIAPANDLNQWTKIQEDGYDNAGTWAVDKLLRNRGKYDAKLPASLPAGDYIVRAEIIALHESDADFQRNPIRGAQFYPSCIQVRVTNGGTGRLPGGISFPGTYTSTSPGILYNLYNKPAPLPYPIPGGPVWHG